MSVAHLVCKSVIAVVRVLKERDSHNKDSTGLRRFVCTACRGIRDSCWEWGIGGLAGRSLPRAFTRHSHRAMTWRHEKWRRRRRLLFTLRLLLSGPWPTKNKNEPHSVPAISCLRTAATGVLWYDFIYLPMSETILGTRPAIVMQTVNKTANARGSHYCFCFFFLCFFRAALEAVRSRRATRIWTGISATCIKLSRNCNSPIHIFPINWSVSSNNCLRNSIKLGSSSCFRNRSLRPGASSHRERNQWICFCSFCSPGK